MKTNIKNHHDAAGKLHEIWRELPETSRDIIFSELSKILERSDKIKLACQKWREFEELETLDYIYFKCLKAKEKLPPQQAEEANNQPS